AEGLLRRAEDGIHQRAGRQPVPHARMAQRLGAVMKRLVLAVTTTAVVSGCAMFHKSCDRAEVAAPNHLTACERADGWRLLFDGTTTKGWRDYHADTISSKAWRVIDGVLTKTA